MRSSVRSRRCIRFPLAGDLARDGQLQVGEGTLTAEEAGLREAYVSGARVPVPVWRSPRAEELSPLTDGISLPGETLTFFRGAKSGDEAPVRNALELGRVLATRPDDPGASASLAHSAGDIFAALTGWHREEIHIAERARATCNEAGLVTASRDPDQDGLLVGLHVDSPGPVHLTERPKCLRLFCVNIGSEPRALLFSSASMSGIAAALEPTYGEEAVRIGANTAAKAFLGLRPDCLVFRLRLDPGQGYLAPVQNMIHDGSTERTRAVSVALKALGERSRRG